MSKCSDMKLGEVYICEDCGLELEVVKECGNEMTEGTTCESQPCTLACCNKELVKKS
ncbi:MAG: hypothetical protein ABFD54_06640 [Armatimonadota bacterium]|nr:hypothetical protein [bacterium]